MLTSFYCTFFPLHFLISSFTFPPLCSRLIPSLSSVIDLRVSWPKLTSGGDCSWIAWCHCFVSLASPFLSFLTQSCPHHRLPALHASPQRLCLLRCLSAPGSCHNYMGVWWEWHSVCTPVCDLKSYTILWSSPWNWNMSFHNQIYHFSL